jgi:hypothetical protein
MTTQTPISDTQKGRLEKIVIENNTYDRFYQAKHAKADSGLVAKNKAAISAVQKLDKEISAESTAKDNNYSTTRDKQREEVKTVDARHEKELNSLRIKHRLEDDARTKRQSKEIDLSTEKYNAKIESVSKKKDKLEEGLKSVGLRSQYVHSNEYKWVPDINRFQDEYQNWLRDLRARIITATSAEEAKALVDEFLLK